MDIGGQVVRFVSNVGTERSSTSYEQSYDRIGSNISEVVRGPYFFGHSLTLSGEIASELYRKFPRGEEGLNSALRGLSDPWGGVGDVLLHALDEKVALQGHDSRRVSFVAPLQARLSKEDCVLIEGMLTYTVRAASKDTAEACVLVITGVDTKGRRIARRIPLSGKRWAKEKDGYRLTRTQPIVGAKHLTLTLRLATFELGYVKVDARVESLPLLLSAYNALFPDTRKFTSSLLQPVRTESRSYEKQVALLFTYCGMPVEYIGEGSDKEAPDLLVQVPGTELVLVVEITVGPLNQKGKLGRLTQRAEQVRTLIGRAGGEVLPVIITSNPRVAIAQNELDAAKADGVRVLAQEDLTVLLGMAVRRAPVRHVAKYLAPHMVAGPLPALWTLGKVHGHVFDESD
jgi:hypothetical protein